MTTTLRLRAAEAVETDLEVVYFNIPDFVPTSSPKVGWPASYAAPSVIYITTGGIGMSGDESLTALIGAHAAPPQPSAPVLAALRRVSANVAQGALSSVVVETSGFGMDDSDEVALRALFAD